MKLQHLRTIIREDLNERGMFHDPVGYTKSNTKSKYFQGKSQSEVEQELIEDLKEMEKKGFKSYNMIGWIERNINPFESMGWDTSFLLRLINKYK